MFWRTPAFGACNGVSGDSPAGSGEFLTRTHRVLSPPTVVPSRPTFTPPGAERLRFEG